MIFYQLQLLSEVKRNDDITHIEILQFVRRLQIKQEDTAFEKDRVRTELIASQMENEKLIEENEDLAVDNEDLIKERDEILQIYDELFRESERLKAEVRNYYRRFMVDFTVGFGISPPLPSPSLPPPSPVLTKIP